MCIGNAPISAKNCSDAPWLQKDECDNPQCKYCDCEGELFEMEYSYKGHHYKEYMCRECLLETIEIEGSLEGYVNGLLIQNQIQ